MIVDLLEQREAQAYALAQAQVERSADTILWAIVGSHAVLIVGMLFAAVLA